ncbi:hypothetical protein FHT00_003118 [Sphingomonas insulae]|uniref:Uncharacterized protein n=1 Tax=Sphingomonas insulae TaxID=424800 RepID=A0ABN1I134_9SPHN|nr:hypothetical protein [Sphingomonas insulae]NIJ31139.1 hypothetical protein [Sphingomonas insulae]
MTRKTHDRGGWFAPKRFGYGAGLPIAWQGWVVYAAYVAVIAAASTAGRRWSPAIVVPATLLLILVCRRHTRGGWRWRTGAGD